MLSAKRKLTLLGQIERLLFPINCLGCGLESDWLCPSCKKTLKPASNFQCAICKKAAKTGLCNKCEKETGLNGIVALLDYKDPKVKELVAKLKYEGNTEIVEFFVRNFSREIWRELPDGDWRYAFVPQTMERSRERGYNQAELLAQALGSNEVYKGIVKTKETVAQATLSKKLRKTNLIKAFRVKSAPPERVIVCDDVITTGSTLGQVAKMLKKNGTKEVWAITIAHD